MSFRLIDKDWDKELRDAVDLGCSRVRVIAPFIKYRAARRLLSEGNPTKLEVITRFNLDDFRDGVSDTAALMLLLEAGARIRGVKNLHAKLYLFGDRRAIVTSANLTEAALTRNHEFGFVADDAAIVCRCGEYFDELWGRAGDDLLGTRLLDWDRLVTESLAHDAGRPEAPTLGDLGSDAGLQGEQIELPVRVVESERAFVKFFGTSRDRAETDMPVFDEVMESGSHWACNYPRDRRPRQVQDGDIIFMGRMVLPQDILIYGRATGMRHVDGRDDATEEDIRVRAFKRIWPHYIRVHHAEFVAGTLANGVSLNKMMEALGPVCFATTKRRMMTEEQDISPRSAYGRLPGVALSPEGAQWINERLETSFSSHGRIPSAQLAALDWPSFSNPD